MAPEPHHADEDALRAAARERLRAMVIDVAPVFGFTVTFALTHRLALALALALTAAAGVSVYRLVHRKPVWRALTVLGLVCVQGTVAASTGDATDFFLPNLILHGAMATANVVMLLLRWPLMGVAVGLVTKEGTGWRRCAVRRRAFSRGSLVMLVGGLLTLTVQLSLYLSDQAVLLGIVDSVGPLVLALSTLLGWRVHRRSLGTHRCGTPAPVHTPSTHSLPLERTLP